MTRTTRWPNQLRSLWKNCQKPRVNKLLYSNYYLQKEIVKIGYLGLSQPQANIKWSKIMSLHNINAWTSTMTKIMIMVLVKIMSDDKKENFSSLPKGAAVDCRDWPTNLDAKNHCPTDFDVKTNHHPCPTPLLKNDRGWELDCTALIYWHV